MTDISNESMLPWLNAGRNSLDNLMLFLHGRLVDMNSYATATLVRFKPQ